MSGNADEFEALAREIWFLQPPFRSLTGATNAGNGDFDVDLQAPDLESVSAFNTQMARILDLYNSRLVGKLLPLATSEKRATKRKLKLSLELERRVTAPYEYQVPVRGEEPCLIDGLTFEIRVFALQHRQPYGISVKQAREYMAQWGGVHIYDAGFRIPYAGADADWLRL